jgi:hypothetical protein
MGLRSGEIIFHLDNVSEQHRRSLRAKWLATQTSKSTHQHQNLGVVEIFVVVARPWCLAPTTFLIAL